MLLTGRGSAAEWHTGTRTAKSALLRSLTDTEPYVEISPGDAAALGIVRQWLAESGLEYPSVAALVVAAVPPK